jgi:hypothetical protein
MNVKLKRGILAAAAVAALGLGGAAIGGATGGGDDGGGKGDDGSQVDVHLDSHFNVLNESADGEGADAD